MFQNDEVRGASMCGQKFFGKKLVVFFTFGNSLESWKRVGLYEREMAIYMLLSKHFSDIYLFTYGKNDKQYASTLPKNVHILHKKFSMNNFVYSWLAPFLYKKEFSSADLYKTNQMLGAWVAILAKILYKKQLVVRTGYTASVFYKRDHKFLKYYFAKLLEAVAGIFADTFIVSSENEIKYIRSKHTVVVPNYVDTDFLSIPNNKKTTPTVKVLFVGRFEYQKNIFNLLEAIKNIENIQLILVGNGTFKDQIQEKIKKENLPVDIMGNVPFSELKSLYQSVDLFVLPSLFEGTPKVLLEAMSCSLPVLATNVEGTKEIIKHKINGYLCETSSDSIRAGIQTMINNKEMSRQMGQNAREYIVSKYGLSEIAKQELDIYSLLLS